MVGKEHYFCFTCFDYQLPGLMVMGYNPLEEVQKYYWAKRSKWALEYMPYPCKRCGEPATFYVHLRELPPEALNGS